MSGSRGRPPKGARTKSNSRSSGRPVPPLELTGDPVKDGILALRIYFGEEGRPLSNADLGKRYKVGETTVRHWATGYRTPAPLAQDLIDRDWAEIAKKRPDLAEAAKLVF